MREFYLLVAFAAAALLGYKLISEVPSLLHTPLMSGMNALSGITVVGALVSTGTAVIASASGSQAVGFMAIVLAIINVVAGFLVTHRMLRMFKSEGGKNS